MIIINALLILQLDNSFMNKSFDNIEKIVSGIPYRSKCRQKAVTDIKGLKMKLCPK